MSEKLKPCPFCGNEVKLISRPIKFGSDERVYYIECQCGITTGEAADCHSAEKTWNRRNKK